MADDGLVLLSGELEELIGRHFAAEDQPVVRETLRSYGALRPGPVTDRVQFDLLHLCAGDVDRVKRLAKMAASDPRDVMVHE
jgi:hypothetical protein